MQISNEVITGAEGINSNILDPKNALIEFYKAFNSKDMALMSSNWEQTDEASMSNPLGGIKRGWGSIKEIYENIFNDLAKVYVEFYDYTIEQSGAIFIAVGRERGYLIKDKYRLELIIRTSRIYRLKNGKWHQIHHHGSIETPSLLDEYQAIILNKK